MIKGFLIDIEGTIVKDKSYTPIPKAIQWLNSVKHYNKTFLLATNNTTHKPEGIAKLLNKKGFRIQTEQIHSCLSLALDCIFSKKIKSCFVIANQNIKNFLRENKIEVKEDWKVDAVLVGLDRNLNYNKLKIATRAIIQNKAKFLALHKNKIYKDKKGELAPSVGSLVKSLEYATDKKATVFGKPNRFFYTKALQKLNLKPTFVLMISDDALSDLIGAKKVGIKTAFVTSGKYDRTILKKIPKKDRPDLVYNNITQIKI